MVKNEPDFLNWMKTGDMEFVGKYDFPKIRGIKLKNPDELNMIGFNYATNPATKDKEKQWVHFFLPDYRFTQVWNNPDKYTELFRQYKGILTPNYSTYVGMSRAMQIWNIYRNCWLQAYYQMRGVKILPALLWSDEESYDYCFDWVPKHSAVVVSTVGCMQDKDAYRLFCKGFDKALEICEPAQVIMYGKVTDEVIRMYPEMRRVPSLMETRKEIIRFNNEVKEKISSMENLKVFVEKDNRKQIEVNL